MFQLALEFQNYWRSFVRILYPAYCASCRIPLVLNEIYLCTACTQSIETLKPPLCLKCADPLPPYDGRYTVCSPCRSRKPHFDRGYGLVKYEGPVKTLFHQIKFEGKSWLIKVFMDRTLDHPLSKELDHYDLITFVPLDFFKQRQRGFNQAFLIANMLNKMNPEMKSKFCRLLKKRRRTSPQSQLRREERLTNLKDAFGVTDRKKIDGKRILLIDDIFTTGSTINECAKVLKEHGAERVDFFACARS